ncbi:RNA polymerase sigma factor [Fodinicola feengrottensis]|uniref:RNA polymerase sigma factor n=1 Tax=Fodinicola feengrottensis TaxID=435914 RepID=UPI0013D82F3F|nr:sigma-70 family RNA polymerase sigma factor [Fodinicola feengrottensis]
MSGGNGAADGSGDRLDSGQAPAGPSDAELITAAARAGDTGAFETLYRRHSEAAQRYAMSLTHNPADRDDLVSEAFAKVLSTLRNGGGPDLAFRSYLLSAVRNTFYDRTRRDRRLEVTDDMERHDRGVAFTDTVVEGLERTLAARAFATLPERWQMVLWHTEVEGDSPAEVAPLLGLTPNGVAALAYRARERLRQAYLSVHVADAPQTTVVAGSTCGWTAERLGARVRGGLSNREATKIDAHLHDCAQCKLLYAELGELNSSLRNVLGPLILGTAIAGYFVKPAAILAGASTGLAGMWHWVLLLLGRIKDFFKQPSGIATGVGAVVVVVAVVAAAFALTSGQPKPKPPTAAAPNKPNRRPARRRRWWRARAPAPRRRPRPTSRTSRPTTSRPAARSRPASQRPRARCRPRRPARSPSRRSASPRSGRWRPAGPA